MPHAVICGECSHPIKLWKVCLEGGKLNSCLEATAVSSCF